MQDKMRNVDFNLNLVVKKILSSDFHLFLEYRKAKLGQNLQSELSVMRRTTSIVTALHFQIEMFLPARTTWADSPC